jgi:hypothetical protein
MEDVRSELVENLQQGQQALETAGYDVSGYEARVNSDAAKAGIGASGETPEEAVDELMTQLDSEDSFFVHVAGDELYSMIDGEKDPESLIYSNITGTVEVNEPDVPETYGGTEIEYIPGTENQWEINTYDVEDGQERAENAAEALEEFGVEAEVGHIHQ